MRMCPPNYHPANTEKSEARQRRKVSWPSESDLSHSWPATPSEAPDPGPEQLLVSLKSLFTLQAITN